MGLADFLEHGTPEVTISGINLSALTAAEDTPRGPQTGVPWDVEPTPPPG